MDIVTAFLYGCFNEIIYVEQSHLFELNFELICCLCKELYGLKHALYIWYQTIADFVKKLSLERFELNHGVFVS